MFVDDKGYRKRNDDQIPNYQKEKKWIVSQKIPNISIKHVAKLQRSRLFIIISL